MARKENVVIKEVFEAEITAMFNAYHDTTGTGLYFGIYLLSILYIFVHVKEENKNIKSYFLIYPVIVLLLVWNPLFAKILIKYIGNDVYWRVYWLLPIGITMSYCFTNMIFNSTGKVKRIVASIATLVIIVMSGKNIYNSVNFQKVDNSYKVPDNVLGLIFTISEDDENYKKVAGPEPFMVYTRQIDGTILIT